MCTPLFHYVFIHTSRCVHFMSTFLCGRTQCTPAWKRQKYKSWEGKCKSKWEQTDMNQFELYQSLGDQLSRFGLLVNMWSVLSQPAWVEPFSQIVTHTCLTFSTVLMDRLPSYASLQDFSERSPGSSVNTWTGCGHVPQFDKHLTLSVQTRAQYISWSIGLWDPVVVGRKAANWLKQCGGMLWWWPVPSSLGSPP